MLATDGIQTYALFLYRDIQWGSSFTSIGFNAEGGSQFFNLPESFTVETVLGIKTSCNVGAGYPGAYFFRIDQNITQPPGT